MSEGKPTTRLIVLTLGEPQFGVTVDGVSETLTIPENAIDPIANVALDVDAECVTGVARLQRKLVILLDYQRIIAAEEREQLAALVAEEVPA